VDSDWTDAAIKKYVEVAGGEFISIYAAECNDTGCLTRTDGASREILVKDRLHFTEAGAIFVTAKLQDQIFRGTRLLP
jgi:hypothetical protein